MMLDHRSHKSLFEIGLKPKVVFCKKVRKIFFEFRLRFFKKQAKFKKFLRKPPFLSQKTVPRKS